MKHLLTNTRETKKYAAEMARGIIKRGPEKSDAVIIGLIGDLGAGKTTFAQGFARALGVRGRLPSPTFLFYRAYPILHQFLKIVRPDHF